MALLKIAGVTADIQYKYPRLLAQAEPYRIEDTGEKPDVKIHLSDEFLQKKQEENPHLSLDQCEYIWTASYFYMAMLCKGGYMLHASAVVVDGVGYLFSAPSGVGKSTHTNEWLKLFGDRAYILNDDKPIIKFENGVLLAYGAPWSGNSPLNVNTSVPIAGICFLHQSPENSIRQLTAAEAVPELMNQTSRPPEPSYMDRILAYIETTIANVPIYSMGCNISKEAAVMAYEAMRPKENNLI